MTIVNFKRLQPLNIGIKDNILIKDLTDYIGVLIWASSTVCCAASPTYHKA